MDEFVDILDEFGNFTGETSLKSVAHAKGLYHPTIHVWVYTANGKILLQQRGKNKETYPLKWDVSIAGHIGAGEAIENGAVREVAEEIGVAIKIENLFKIGVFKTEKQHSKTIFDREFNHTFLCLLDDGIRLTKQETEVEALKWVRIQEFKELITKDNSGLVPNSKERYRYIITEIESRL